MEKITLENIAPYIAYKLKVKSKLGEVFELTPYPIAGKNLTYIQEFFENEDKPLLRPMDLTKPIQVDGKEVVPIVELAKISFPYYNWVFKNGECVSGGFGNIIRFKFLNDFFYCSDNDPMHVEHQLALFQRLFKHHFDVFRLIEKGLAIDLTQHP